MFLYYGVIGKKRTRPHLTWENCIKRDVGKANEERAQVVMEISGKKLQIKQCSSQPH